MNVKFVILVLFCIQNINTNPVSDEVYDYSDLDDINNKETVSSTSPKTTSTTTSTTSTITTSTTTKISTTTPLPDLCIPNPCKNGASCLNDGFQHKCSCLKGYSGSNCEKYDPCHDLKCQNKGSLSPFGNTCSCMCLSDFTGKSCETPIEDSLQKRSEENKSSSKSLPNEFEEEPLPVEINTTESPDIENSASNISVFSTLKFYLFSTLILSIFLL